VTSYLRFAEDMQELETPPWVVWVILGCLAVVVLVIVGSFIDNSIKVRRRRRREQARDNYWVRRNSTGRIKPMSIPRELREEYAADFPKHDGDDWMTCGLPSSTYAYCSLRYGHKGEHVAYQFDEHGREVPMYRWVHWIPGDA